MKTTTTLLLSVVAFPLLAQVPGGNLHFDGADELYLDSIYPAGCWQVGHPDKPVFTSAYSEPNALVTDTVSPHLDSTTCYAQFTMVADMPEVLGKSISFRYWSDMDSLQSFGWIEKQDVFTQEWRNLQASYAYYVWFYDSGELQTDSGAYFTGRTFGWHEAQVNIECIGVLIEENGERGGGWSDTMRVRFAFRGAANTNGRDGWMIDNVTAMPVQCSGNVGETAEPRMRIYPDPADDHITMDHTGGPPRGTLVEFYRADGPLVGRVLWRGSSRMTWDISKYPNGLYFVKLTGEDHRTSARFMVQH